jgi:hypothetical protein
VNRQRPYCRIAIFSAIWVLLTSPLTTLPLLQLTAQTGNPIARWMSGLPSAAVIAIEGFILIAPPLLGIAFGMLALRHIRSSWKPLDGTLYAKAGLTLGIISTLFATWIFVAGVLSQ